jgi:tetratricopeptide (TPR) repeat protein
LIFLLGCIGIGLVPKRDPKVLLLLFYMGVIFAGLIIFTVVGRFRLPLTIVLVMFAGYGLMEYIDIMRRRNYDISASRRYLAATLAIILLAAPTLIPYRSKTNPASTYHNLGVVEYRKGNYDKAIEYHELAVKAYPKYPEAYNDMGSCYLKLGNKEKALEMYTKADESSATYAESRYNAGLIYMKRKDYPNAIKKFEEALEIRPDYIKAKMQLSFAFFYTERIDEAISLTRELISLEPVNATHHYNLGAMLKAKKQYEEAKAEFEEALKLNPGYEEAKKELQKFN